MDILFFALILIFGAFILWLGYKILEKAGLDGRWSLVLLVPVANIILIWVFAFCHWPNLRSDAKQNPFKPD